MNENWHFLRHQVASSGCQVKPFHLKWMQFHGHGMKERFILVLLLLASIKIFFGVILSPLFLSQGIHQQVKVERQGFEFYKNYSSLCIPGESQFFIKMKLEWLLLLISKLKC